MPKRRTIAWIDDASQETVTHLTSSSGAPNTMANIIANTNADWTNWSEGDITTPGIGSPVPDKYSSVGEVCAIDGNDFGGSSNRVFLPAPIQAMFNADENTADAGSTLFGDIGNAAIGSLVVPESTVLWNNFNHGFLFRGLAQIRETFLVGTANPTNRTVVRWIDFFGAERLCYYISSDNAADFLSEMRIASNAIALQQWQGPLTIHTPPAPSSAIYGSVRDRAELIFTDDAGNKTSIFIPSPKLAVFYADRKTVNATAGPVASLIGWVKAECIVPSSGRAVTDYIGGTLRRSKAPGLE
jgi:hypothetical protein